MIRAQASPSSQKTTVDHVTIGGLDFTPTFSTSNNELDFVIEEADASTFPSFAPLRIDVCADSSCTSSSASTADTLNVRSLGMIALGGTDRLFSFDPGTGAIVDIDSSFDNSIINLPGGAEPTGVAFSNQNAELYVTGGDQFHALARSGAGYPAITASVTVGPDVQELVMDDDGRFAFLLHGSNQIGAVHVDDAAGVSPRFSVATSLGTTLGYARRLAVRNLTPDGDDLRFEVFTTSSCLDCGPGTSDCSSGSISRLEVPPGERLAAHVKRPSPARIETGTAPGSWPSGPGILATGLLAPFLQSCEPGSCEFSPDPPPGGGGGGGTSNRQVWLNTHVLRANRDAAGNVLSWDVECVEKQMVSSEPVSPGIPSWEHVGLALTSDSSMLYVVSPETHELVAVDTASLSEVDRVTVGTFPFDVTVVPVMTLSGAVEERAYVANHGDGEVEDDDSMSIINLGTFTSGAVQTLPVNADFGVTEDVHLERIAGLQARFLGGSIRASQIFLLSGATNRVLSYRVDLNGDSPGAFLNLIVSASPGTVAFQRP